MKHLIKYILFTAFFGMFSVAFAQDQPQKESDLLKKPYRVEADAQKDIDSLLKIAQSTNKNIVLQAGGNWCIWCLRFNDFIHKNANVQEVLAQNFLYYHLNYSPDNKNEAVFQRYAPEGSKLGYPFFIVLSKTGEVLSISDSGHLEENKSYSEARVIEFFKKHTPTTQQQ